MERLIVPNSEGYEDGWRRVVIEGPKEPQTQTEQRKQANKREKASQGKWAWDFFSTVYNLLTFPYKINSEMRKLKHAPIDLYRLKR